MIEKLAPIITPIIQALAWPLVVLLAALVLRRALVELLDALSKRLKEGSAVKFGEILQIEAGVRATQSTEDVKEKVDISGDPDQLQLLFSATAKSRAWKKSTKAMTVPGGCVVQVSTEYVNPGGSRSVAEAVTFVPNVEVVKDKKGSARLSLPAKTK